MFSTKDIADYYNQTQNHYTIWWNLKKTRAVHYGIWFPETKNFAEALKNTNIEMAKLANIQSTDYVLDAGCGVGGSSLYLGTQIGCRVKGITLSEKQYQTALEHIQHEACADKVSIEINDFTQTNYPPETFDVIWACESSCHASPKSSFIQEAYRLLKPGGRLIVCDYFLTDSGLQDPYLDLKHWGETWAITEFNTEKNYIHQLQETGFDLKHQIDYTKEITPSAKRMYHSYLLGWLPSNLYNLTHNTSRFAKTHYLSGKYQYRALQRGEWRYAMILAVK
ncbi:MAG: methyltransferase domain-containing protein [Chitinophagaceae bacterium]|nr:methyltransferase domain-containing protein [Chitinophagaceae bacterium]